MPPSADSCVTSAYADTARASAVPQNRNNGGDDSSNQCRNGRVVVGAADRRELPAEVGGGVQQHRGERNLRRGERPSEQSLDSVRQQVDQGHQEDERQPPGRRDAPIVAHSRQQVPRTRESIFTANEESGREEWTDELERTQRQRDRPGFRSLH